MDSTLKSDLTVGLPLDLVVYQNNRLETQQIVCIDERNPYFQMIRGSWGQKLHQAFESIDGPEWHGATAPAPLLVPSRCEPMRKIGPPGARVA
jgi:putative proteasome-type protease